MTEALTQEQFIDLVRNKMRLIEDCRIFYVLKRYGLRLHVGSASFKMLKAILALHEIGVNEFGAAMIAELAECKFYEGCWNNMHILGDNHVLVKLRGLETTKSVWIVSPVFLEEWEGKVAINGVQS